METIPGSWVKKKKMMFMVTGGEMKKMLCPKEHSVATYGRLVPSFQS